MSKIRLQSNLGGFFAGIVLVAMALGYGIHAGASNSAEDTKASKISESKLPLSIRGVITSSNPDNSVALLQDKKYGKIVAVRKGYVLYRHSKVVDIPSVKTVIIKRRNRFEFIGVRPTNFEPDHYVKSH